MKNILFLSLLISNLFFSQKIHVKYLHVRSPIATLYEDLYIENNKTISRQDSIIHFGDTNSSDGIIAIKPGKSKRAFYFISTIADKNNGKKDFFFTSAVNGNNPNDNYFIHDNVPQPKWIIDDKTTKKVAGYKCVKATTNFRGSLITAYFSRELPYSAGPFKFFGLPGLILDVRVDNKSYDIWKAEKVEIDYKDTVNFRPAFSYHTKIDMKKFIQLKDELMLENNKKTLKSLPIGSKIQSSTNRLSVERVFEWEKQE